MRNKDVRPALILTIAVLAGIGALGFSILGNPFSLDQKLENQSQLGRVFVESHEIRAAFKEYRRLHSKYPKYFDQLGYSQTDIVNSEGIGDARILAGGDLAFRLPEPGGRWVVYDLRYDDGEFSRRCRRNFRVFALAADGGNRCVYEEFSIGGPKAPGGGAAEKRVELCLDAGNDIERLICERKSLTKLQADIEALVRKLRSQYPASREAVDQAAWFRRLEVYCPNPDRGRSRCLAKRLRDRKRLLKEAVAFYRDQ